MRNTVSSVALVIGLLCISCSCAESTPEPGYIEFARYFDANRNVYDEIQELFMTTEWSSACNATGTPGLVIKVMGENEQRVETEPARQIRTLMESGRVYCAHRLESNALALDPSFDSELFGRSFFARVTHNGKQVDLPDCAAARDSAEIAYCVVSLGDKWRIEFSERPD